MWLRRCSFSSTVNACGTNHAQSFCFCKSSHKICCTIVFGTPVRSAMSLRLTIFFQNISYTSYVFTFSHHKHFSTSLLIMNRLSPFWKCYVPMKHCITTYNRVTINFLNHFKCFCVIKTGFPSKTNRCTLFNCFFHYNLWHRQNRQVTSHHKYIPLYEQFELKLGMRGREHLLTNFPKFHRDHATSTMFCVVVKLTG